MKEIKEIKEITELRSTARRGKSNKRNKRNQEFCRKDEITETYKQHRCCFFPLFDFPLRAVDHSSAGHYYNPLNSF